MHIPSVRYLCVYRKVQKAPRRSAGERLGDVSAPLSFAETEEIPLVEAGPAPGVHGCIGLGSLYSWSLPRRPSCAELCECDSERSAGWLVHRSYAAAWVDYTGHNPVFH